MSAKEILKNGANKLNDHSPAILTGLGIAGFGMTVVFAVKATPKAIRIIDSRYSYVTDFDPEDISTAYKIKTLGIKEVVSETWKCYIPTALMGAMSIICFIGSNRVSTLRTAAISSAYSMTEKALKKYEEKVVEILGEDKNSEIRDEIAKDYISNVSNEEIIPYGNGEDLCYESITGRYFKSDIETMRGLLNDFNHSLIGDYYADLNDWFLTLGIPQVKIGDELGWNTSKLLDIRFVSMIAPNGKPAIVLDYLTLPDPFYKRGI